MLEMKKILVPVDFSPRSEAAAKHASVIANHFGAELLFLYAVPHGPYEHGLFEAGYNAGSVWPDQEDIELRVADQLTAFINQIAPPGKTFAHVAWGGAAEKIREVAEEEQVDLIVMPTHGYGPFRRFILGSVTAKTLHDVTFPVFTGTHVEDVPQGEVHPYHVVACAVDLSPHSEVVLAWAKDFAESVGAKLHVIHAAPSLEGLIEDEEHLPPKLAEGVLATRQEQIRALLATSGAHAEIHVACENVTEYVEATAKEIGADILIIGRSSDEGVFGRLRSDSMNLIRESPVPVISV